MPFAARWMGVEIVILGEVKSQKDKYHFYVESFLKN